MEAARQLVLSHFTPSDFNRRGYLAMVSPHADLIQEGNIGLMKAVKRFDSTRAASAWFLCHALDQTEIHEYILKNWRQVKVATTKAQRAFL